MVFLDEKQAKRKFNDFKHLSQKFSGSLLQLVKQKGVFPYEYVDSCEEFSYEKLPYRCEFFSSKVSISV